MEYILLLVGFILLIKGADFFVATMEVTSSGREVPMARIVSPMKF